jgi:sortase A
MRTKIAKFGAKAIRWLNRSVNFSELVRVARVEAARRSFMTLKFAERALWVIAVTSLGYCSIAYASAAVHQHRQRTLLKAARAENGLARDGSGAEAVPSLTSATNAPASTAADHGVLGTIEIPRLNISSIVEEGVDSSTLWEAVGHLPGTALPGQNGNSALASHRDTYFRGLGEVETGDLIVFRSPTANYRYRVESTRIVEGSATDALPDSATPTLSLITCYPFRYIGAAPQRFIVTAHAESPAQ